MVTPRHRAQTKDLIVQSPFPVSLRRRAPLFYFTFALMRGGSIQCVLYSRERIVSFRRHSLLLLCRCLYTFAANSSDHVSNIIVDAHMTHPAKPERITRIHVVRHPLVCKISPTQKDPIRTRSFAIARRSTHAFTALPPAIDEI